MSKPEFSAVAYAMPVRPLVGQSRHAVWAGETPPEQIRAASYAYWRQQGRTAGDALASMREDLAAGTVRFPAHYPDANRTVAAYGEDRMRWFEDPGALGLRLVGLAHEVCPMVIRHEGWCLHPDGYWNGAVAGVVYRMSGRDGRARYLVGHADPWNCDERGRGPALLCLAPMVGGRADAEWEVDPVLRDAARRADRIAERMAAEEREYRGAHDAGWDARQAGRDMRKSVARYAGALRACRVVFRNRHRIGMGDARLVMAVQASHLRDLFARLKAARRAFRDGLATRDDWARVDNNGWRNGYADG